MIASAESPAAMLNPVQLTLVAAMANNRVIGKNNNLPWRLSADLKHFKQLTLGKTILMGRHTWESLPGVLSQRRHLVMTRDPFYKADGAQIVADLPSALSAVQGEEALMVVGGSMIYELSLPHASLLHLTFVDVEVDGDAYFPALNWHDWELYAEASHPADEKNQYAMRFCSYRRIHASI